MEYNNKRHKQLLHVLFNSDVPLTSTELAKKIHVSSRTIKNDLITLKSYLAEENIELVSKKGVGYSLIDNSSLDNNQLKCMYMYQYSSLKIIPSEFLDRVNYLIRRLISATDYLKIETLAEEFGLTRSALSSEIKETRKILKSYRISVKEKPNYGIKIIANEFDLRLCLVDYYEYFFHKLEPEFVVKEFLEIFHFEQEERQAVRRAFLHVLRQHHFSLPDTCSQKIAVHLMLMRNRMNEGHLLNIEPSQVTIIKKFYEYTIAEDITKTLSMFPTFNFSSNETAFIAILLLSGVDLYQKPKSELNYFHLYQDSEKIANQLLIYIFKRYNLQLNDSHLLNDLISILIPLMAKVTFHMSSIQDTPANFGFRGRSITQSPISMEFSYITYEFLKKMIDYEIDAYDMINFAYVYYNAIIRIHFDFKPLRLILICENSKLSADAMRTKILRRYGSFIETMDIYELYELRAVDLKNYEYIITTLPVSVFNVDIPILNVEYFLSEKNMNQIYNDVLMSGYSFSQLLPTIRKENVFENVKVDGIESFLHFLTSTNTTSEKEAKSLYSYLLRRAMKIDDIINETIFLFQLQKDQQPSLDLYQLEKAFLWHEANVKNVIFFKGDSLQNPQILKAYEIVTRHLSEDPSYLDELIECEDSSIYIKILNNSRKSEI